MNRCAYRPTLLIGSSTAGTYLCNSSLALRQRDRERETQRDRATVSRLCVLCVLLIPSQSQGQAVSVCLDAYTCLSIYLSRLDLANLWSQSQVPLFGNALKTTLDLGIAGAECSCLNTRQKVVITVCIHL